MINKNTEKRITVMYEALMDISHMDKGHDCKCQCANHCIDHAHDALVEFVANEMNAYLRKFNQTSTMVELSKAWGGGPLEHDRKKKIGEMEEWTLQLEKSLIHEPRSEETLGSWEECRICKCGHGKIFNGEKWDEWKTPLIHADYCVLSKKPKVS